MSKSLEERIGALEALVASLAANVHPLNAVEKVTAKQEYPKQIGKGKDARVAYSAEDDEKSLLLADGV